MHLRHIAGWWTTNRKSDTDLFAQYEVSVTVPMQS